MINIAIKLATSITYTADGSQTNFSVPFDYLRPSFVHVAVDDAEVSEGFTISNRMVMFDAAPAKDAVVHIYRSTPTTRLVSWADASILKAIDMTIAEVQQLHILEEANDWTKTNSIVLNDEGNAWQGRNYRVSNVSDPTEAQDVVTKNYLENTEDSFVQRMNAIKTQTEQFANTAGNNKDSAYKSAQSASVSAASAAESARLAEGYKNVAETAKSDAALYAANAKTSADNAGASKEAAQSAATTASNFANASRSSANEARTYRDNAKTYMDNTELYMNNAKNYSENVNVFIPSVSSDGVLSWTNKAGLPNPTSVNIKGAKGDTGTAASIKIGSVTTGAAGSNASVTNSGTASNVVLNFTLPRGKDGADGGVTVDAELSDTSTNPVQNKVIYNALLGKVGTDIFSGFALLGVATQIRWREGTQVIGAISAKNYTGTAMAASYDADGNRISTTYVKSVNNTKPDASGNVTINVGGGVSTSEANDWSAQQYFYMAKFQLEKYDTSYTSGTTMNPTTVTSIYNATGNLTLDLTNLTSLLSAGESIVFTAYITSAADYALTITNGGTLKYIGSPSDLAITSAGLLLNIFITLDNSGNKTSIVQASKLS
nr:MAG TPA: tail fiber protein [Bacteriophage sp.]